MRLFLFNRPKIITEALIVDKCMTRLLKERDQVSHFANALGLREEQKA